MQLFDDNQKALNLIKNLEHHARIKHINVQYHYIKEVVADDLIETNYMFINEMIVDILIKSLMAKIFFHFKKKLGFIKMNF